MFTLFFSSRQAAINRNPDGDPDPLKVPRLISIKPTELPSAAVECNTIINPKLSNPVLNVSPAKISSSTDAVKVEKLTLNFSTTDSKKAEILSQDIKMSESTNLTDTERAQKCIQDPSFQNVHGRLNALFKGESTDDYIVPQTALRELKSLDAHVKNLDTSIFRLKKIKADLDKIEPLKVDEYIKGYKSFLAGSLDIKNVDKLAIEEKVALVQTAFSSFITSTFGVLNSIMSAGGLKSFLLAIAGSSTAPVAIGTLLTTSIIAGGTGFIVSNFVFKLFLEYPVRKIYEIKSPMISESKLDELQQKLLNDISSLEESNNAKKQIILSVHQKITNPPVIENDIDD